MNNFISAKFCDKLINISLSGISSSVILLSICLTFSNILYIASFASLSLFRKILKFENCNKASIESGQIVNAWDILFSQIFSAFGSSHKSVVIYNDAIEDKALAIDSFISFSLFISFLLSSKLLLYN